MAILTPQQKHFLVGMWAQFRSLEEIHKAWKIEYGTDITSEAIRRYNPGLRAGRKLAKPLREFFVKTRQRFQERLEAELPMANKAVRVRKLQEAAEQYENMGNYKMMADMLEQIAKEMGDVHTNRKEFTGKGGGPIQYQDVTDMTDEQLDAELAEILAEMKVPSR